MRRCDDRIVCAKATPAAETHATTNQRTTVSGASQATANAVAMHAAHMTFARNLDRMVDVVEGRIGMNDGTEWPKFICEPARQFGEPMAAHAQGKRP